MLIGTILIWYFLLLLGWSAIFLSGLGSVIESSSGASTDLLQRIYFTGATISTVGYGDLVPSRPPWTILANVAAFTTTFLITTSLSYMIPIISAARDRRHLATAIRAVGRSPEELIAQSWTKGNSQVATNYWLTLFDLISQHAQAHLIYPVLHYFHSENGKASSPGAILDLADAVFLIGQTSEHEDRPPSFFFTLAWSSLHEYGRVKTLDMTHAHFTQNQNNIDHLSVSALQKLNLPLRDEREYEPALEEYLKLRHRLVQLCLEDGWFPPGKESGAR